MQDISQELEKESAAEKQKITCLAYYHCSITENIPEDTVVEPEPEYLLQPLPEEKEALHTLLQKECARSKPSKTSTIASFPEIDFLRSILCKLHYEIPKDLQCRLYVLFLGVDATVVPSLADSTWKADNVNNGILEEYVHSILPRFTTSCRNNCNTGLAHVQQLVRRRSLRMFYG